MLLLALETATPATSVALLRGAQLLAAVDDDGGRPHSERLLHAIQEVLAEAGVGHDEIAAYAVSVGPGSFTGLRIGIATAQGFALVDRRPLIGVPTLAALGTAATTPGPVGALIDARRGEVYAAAYTHASKAEADALPEGLYRPEEVALALPDGAVLVGATGTGAALEAASGVRPDLQIVEAPCRAQRVGALAALLSPGAGPLRPRYVRRAEAEVKRTGRATE